MNYRDPPHYLKPLISTTTPKRLAWLDCHAQTRRERGAYVERWASGALGTTHYTRRLNKRVDTLTSHASAAELWKQVDDYCPVGRRVVLFAHDLAYQLRVSQCLTQLTALGWRLDRIVLERTAAWALLREGKRSLLCCDLQAWCPVDFARLRIDVEATCDRPTFHYLNMDSDATPTTRRAVVIRESVLQILAWVEAESLGPFRPTGSGQSYSAFRRRFLTHHILVHDDTARLDLERRAMHTGRCEAWRHGDLRLGPFIEYDLHAAYATIAAECEVPTLAVGVMTKPTVQRMLEEHSHYAFIADITVETELPVLPLRLSDRTVWPVGRFRTQVWDAEFLLACAYCETVTVHKAWKYKRAPVLQAFAKWVLDGLSAQTQVYGLAPNRVLKHWSRCMIGRLGLRYRAWEKFGTSPIPDLRLVTYLDIDEGVATDMLCAGFDRLILTEMREALESVPQIPGWVMSECRRRLWETMARCGLGNVVYVDTDSIVLRDGKAAHLSDRHTLMKSGGWDQKGAYNRMTIHGPRNLVCEHDRRVSGLPLMARQVAPLEFDGVVMRSIKESMRAGELDCVSSLPRTFHLTSGDLRREHLPNGATAPYRIEAQDDK